MNNRFAMNSILVRGAVAATLLSASVAQAASFGEALAATKPIIDARIRYENVEQTPLVEEADADTLRLRLGFDTGKVLGTSLLAEGEFVWPFDGDYRDDTAVAKNTAYPVVPDPEVYELNRLHLTNTSLPGTTITLGRQRILLDDHRFVGNVGWRQNEQTFDAARFVNKSVKSLTIDMSYLNQVNRIFGPDSPQGRFEGDGYLGNVGYQTPVGKLTGFAYVLDFDPILPPSSPAGLNPVRSSTETYGIRFAGDRMIGKFKFGYVASYATQENYGDNPLTFDLDYRLVEVSGTFAQFTLGLGQEVLEGDGVVGFATPLATLHKFNGWTDKFLATPANGIDDRFVSLGFAQKGLGPIETLSAVVAYHDYESERANLDLGTEINVQIAAKWQRFQGTLKYADYDAKPTPATAAYQDTTKYWVMIEYAW